MIDIYLLSFSSLPFCFFHIPVFISPLCHVFFVTLSTVPLRCSLHPRFLPILLLSSSSLLFCLSIFQALFPFFIPRLLCYPFYYALTLQSPLPLSSYTAFVPLFPALLYFPVASFIYLLPATLSLILLPPRRSSCPQPGNKRSNAIIVLIAFRFSTALPLLTNLHTLCLEPTSDPSFVLFPVLLSFPIPFFFYLLPASLSLNPPASPPILMSSTSEISDQILSSCSSLPVFPPRIAFRLPSAPFKSRIFVLG